MPEMTFAQALNAALREEMRQDPAVVLLGEDIGLHGGVFTVTRDLFSEFGIKRVRDTPISEAAFIGLALGAAMTGLRPVVEIMYMDFMLVAADQIVNQVAKMRYMSGGQVKVPLVIRTQQGGGRGNGAQHSQSLDALWSHVPGLKVVLPSTPSDARMLLKASIRDDNPVIFIEHKLLYQTRGEVSLGDDALPLGVAAIRRTGEDVTIAALSYSVLTALKAAEQLADEGISSEVIDLRSTQPLDIATIVQSVRKTSRLVLIHEAVQFGSILSEIAATVQELALDSLDAPIRRVGALNGPLAYSQPLEQVLLPSSDQLVGVVREVMR